MDSLNVTACSSCGAAISIEQVATPMPTPATDFNLAGAISRAHQDAWARLLLPEAGLRGELAAGPSIGSSAHGAPGCVLFSMRGLDEVDRDEDLEPDPDGAGDDGCDDGYA